jgi:hypothetical protein
MTSEINSEEQLEFIEMVAIQLISQFIPQLRLMCNRRNFFTHAGILAEMYDWSIEFFERYYHEFAVNTEPADLEEAAIAFGHSKLDRLSAAPVHLDKYFINKYNTLKPAYV